MAVTETPEDMTVITGRQYLESLMNGEGAAPFGVLLGIILTEVADGEVVFEGTPKAEFYNPQGVVHGGYAATMLDSALGCAIHSRLEKAKSYTTLELKVNYIRALTADTGPVKCTAKVVHMGRRTATAEGRILDGNGKLIAHGSTTCMIFQ